MSKMNAVHTLKLYASVMIPVLQWCSNALCDYILCACVLFFVFACVSRYMKRRCEFLERFPGLNYNQSKLLYTSFQNCNSFLEMKERKNADLLYDVMCSCL